MQTHTKGAMMDSRFAEELEALRKAVADFPPAAQDSVAKMLLEQLMREFGQQHELVTNVFRKTPK